MVPVSTMVLPDKTGLVYRDVPLSSVLWLRVPRVSLAEQEACPAPLPVDIKEPWHLEMPLLFGGAGQDVAGYFTSLLGEFPWGAWLSHRAA